MFSGLKKMGASALDASKKAAASGLDASKKVAESSKKMAESGMNASKSVATSAVRTATSTVEKASRRPSGGGFSRPAAAAPASTAPRAIQLSRDVAMAFYSADINGDQKLDFAEFCSVVPQDLKEATGMKGVRELFDSVDTDRNGSISLDEFFIWTLQYIEQQTGTGLEVFFRRYDTNREGSLDAREFAQAAEDLGFGPVAHELFLELDPDESGSVTYGELIAYLRANRNIVPFSSNAKRFLTGLAYANTELKHKIDATKWTLEATTVEGLRQELRGLLAQNPGAQVSSLFFAMSIDGSPTLTRDEFPVAMQRIGYQREGLKDYAFAMEVFKAIDTDSSGALGLNDMIMWVNGTEGRRERARKLTLLREPVDAWVMDLRLGTNSVPYPCPLAEVSWDVSSLRKALQLMLIHDEISPLDLLRAYDSDDSGSFSKQEFLVMLKRIVNDLEMWDEELRELCVAAFRVAAAGDRSIDVTEFEIWLSNGWRQLKRNLRGEMAGGPAPAPAPTEEEMAWGAPAPAPAGLSASSSFRRRRSPPKLGIARSGKPDVGRSRGYQGTLYEGRPPSAEPPKRPKSGQRGGRASIMLLPPPSTPELRMSMSAGALSHVGRVRSHKQEMMLIELLSPLASMPREVGGSRSTSPSPPNSPPPRPRHILVGSLP